MSSDGTDNSRRRFLLTGTVAVVGGAGLVGAAVPFIKMWQPSARAEAAGAPVEADISKLQPGQKIQVEWRGKPVWIVRRTEEMLANLKDNGDQLRDPDSTEEQQPEFAENYYRARESRPEILVLVGLCTHLGCSPKFVPEITPQPYDENWQGGFFCPCHSSRFDLSGRVFAGVPAPTNLVVPQYSFLDENRIIIGVGDEGVA